MKNLILAAALLFTTSAAAHEMTPTYPKFDLSYVEGVVVTKMKLWNRRQDVQYYEVTVVDKMWKPLPFATSERLMQVDFLETVTFDVYIKKEDLKNVEYICTTSKQLKDDVLSTGVRSMICSRIAR